MDRHQELSTIIALRSVGFPAVHVTILPLADKAVDRILESFRRGADRGPEVVTAVVTEEKPSCSASKRQSRRRECRGHD
jgi:hypothetical protein